MMRELCDALNRVIRVHFGVGVPEYDHVTFKIHIRGQPGNSVPDTRCFGGKDRNSPRPLLGEATGFRTTAVAFALIVALKRVKNCSF